MVWKDLLVTFTQPSRTLYLNMIIQTYKCKTYVCTQKIRRSVHLLNCNEDQSP